MIIVSQKTQRENNQPIKNHIVFLMHLTIMKKKSVTKNEIIFFVSFFIFILLSSILLLHNFESLGHAPLTWGEIRKEMWKFVVVCVIGSFICTFKIQNYLRK